MDLSRDMGSVVLQGAAEALRDLPAASIDCIITSPPYYDLRTYSDSTSEVGRETTVTRYIDRLMEVFGEAYHVLKDGGSLWVNIGETFRNGRPLGVPELLAAQINIRMPRRNTIIWYKPDSMAESTQRRFSQKWEPFYWFTKSQSAEYYFNADAGKIPVTKSFADRLSHKFNTSEEDVSRMRGLTGDASSKIEQYLQKGVNAGDLWIIPKDKDRTGHPAPFPVALVVRPIVACCPPGGIVLDPFAGSGTVGVAVYRIGGDRKFIGCDINADHVRNANIRIREEVSQGRLF